jgi:Tfp pilus assembly protein PilO
MTMDPHDGPRMPYPPARWSGPERRQNWKAPEESWHLDKRVNIALIIAIAVQLAGFIWYAAKQDAAMTQLRTEVALIQTERREEARADGVQRETLATLKETALQHQRTLERIERHIEAFGRRAGVAP